MGGVEFIGIGDDFFTYTYLSFADPGYKLCN